MIIKFSTFSMEATVNNNSISIFNVKDSEGNCVMMWAENMIIKDVLKLADKIINAFKNSIKILDLNTPKKEIIKVEEIKVLPIIKTIHELECLIHNKTVNNKEYDLKDLEFKTDKSTIYKQCDTKLNDLGKYCIVEKSYGTEDSDKKIIITYKVRHIKSRDALKFICLENEIIVR